MQYDFGGVQISENEDQELRSWDNFAKEARTFLETIPNHLKEQVQTSLFDGPLPATKEVFEREMQRFNEKIRSVAVREEQVIGEWLEYTRIRKTSLTS